MNTSHHLNIQLQTHEGVSTIDHNSWNRLVKEESPFLEHGFLALLEETGCTGESTGWIPMIFTATSLVQGTSELVGALPMYLKTNSAGEFVHDWGWANAAQRAGLPYYPKGVVAIPFTPATGRRLLIAPWLEHEVQHELERTLVNAALDFASRAGLSSMHFNFILERERTVFTELDIPLRYGMQYHWYNGGSGHGMDSCYDSFDAFLSKFRAKRRANMRRERRLVHEAGVVTRVVQGDAINEELMESMFAFYKSTIHKFFWGKQYLTHEFFMRLPERMGHRLHFVVATHDGYDFAGAFNMFKNDRLYGRYWGCTKEIKNTHFEVCMYKPIAWCIDHGVRVFEPGAGGEHKYDRGFEPTRTLSAHHIIHPGFDAAVRGFLEEERRAVECQIQELKNCSNLKGVK